MPGLGKGLNVKKRWREKNDVEVWAWCSQDSGIMRQDMVPSPREHECTSLRMTLATGSKNPAQWTEATRTFITCIRGSLGEAWRQSCLMQWFSDVLKDPGSFRFLCSFLVLPLIVTMGLQKRHTQHRSGSFISLFKSQKSISRNTPRRPRFMLW